AERDAQRRIREIDRERAESARAASDLARERDLMTERLTQERDGALESAAAAVAERAELARQSGEISVAMRDAEDALAAMHSQDDLGPLRRAADEASRRAAEAEARAAELMRRVPELEASLDRALAQREQLARDTDRSVHLAEERLRE